MTDFETKLLDVLGEIRDELAGLNSSVNDQTTEIADEIRETKFTMLDIATNSPMGFHRDLDIIANEIIPGFAEFNPEDPLGKRFNASTGMTQCKRRSSAP